MNTSEELNFMFRILMFLLSLYFLFNVTDDYEKIGTRLGIGILLMITFMFAIVFITCLSKNK